MPHFNEFRINEQLLGRVIVARKNFDLSATLEEQMEVRKFLAEIEEEKREKSKSFKVRFLEFITKKKYVEFQDVDGFNTMRQYNPEESISPEIRLSQTIERPIDFGDDVGAWREYIHEENIRSEEERIEKEKQAKSWKELIEVYSHSILKKMMKVN